MHNLTNGSFEKFDAMANTFFNKLILKPQKISPVKCLEDLLKTNFIVGEFHYAVSPKNFLIRNMSLLKKSGFKTLFIEGLYYEHQKALDDFILNPSINQMDGALSQHLEALDSANFPCYERYDLTDRWKDNNYSALIKAAKRVGIRIVGIDTSITLQLAHKEMRSNPDGWMHNRLKYMNFIASQIISEVTKHYFSEEKWCLLTGVLHAKTFDKKIFGLSHILDAPCVFVEETDGLTLNQKIQYNFIYQTSSVLTCPVPQKIREKYSGKCNLDLFLPNVNLEVYITNNPFKETPLISSLIVEPFLEIENDQELSEKQFNYAMQNYINYKNQFFGLPWSFSSEESKEAMYKIIKADNGQKRLSIATKYISTYPDKEFSIQLKNACNMRI